MPVSTTKLPREGADVQRLSRILQIRNAQKFFINHRLLRIILEAPETFQSLPTTFKGTGGPS